MRAVPLRQCRQCPAAGCAGGSHRRPHCAAQAPGAAGAALPEADCTAEAPRLTISVARLEQLSPPCWSWAARPGSISRWKRSPGWRSSREKPGVVRRSAPGLGDRDEPALRTLLERARALGFTGVLIGNLGHLPLVRGLNFHLYGDYGLNVFNSRSLAI
ncbi:MAG: hypothetical protein ACLTYN_02705 [Dysosmobacter welbionis]